MSQSPALFHTLQISAGVFPPGFSPLVDLARRSNLKADQARASKAVDNYTAALENFNANMPQCVSSSEYATASGCEAYRKHFGSINCPAITASSKDSLQAVADTIKCTCEATQNIDVLAFESCAKVLCTGTDAQKAVGIVENMKKDGATKCWAVYDEAEKFIKESAAPSVRVSVKGAVVVALLVPALGLVGLGW